MKIQTKQKGFTLVEIAIVLVIVGLLIGGVLKGQEMITNAKIKRMESDNAGAQAAMFSYQDRYLQLPGDDNGAKDRFSTDPEDGDGDGIIFGDWNSSTTTDETRRFWLHLRAAGLVVGGPTDDTLALNAYGGRIGIHDGGLGLGGHILVFGGIDGSVARVLEARLDDGVPSTGRVRSQTARAMTIDDNPTDTDVTTYNDVSRYDMAFRL